MLTKVPMSFPPYGGKEKIEKLLGKLTDIALSRPYFFLCQYLQSAFTTRKKFKK